MPPNEETAHGTAGILAELKGGKENGAAKAKIGVTSAESMGDMSYGTGTYEIMGADGTLVDKGTGMLVSKKINGSWEIQCDIWNTSMPLPEPPMKK